jgi:hypothetical protein
MSLRLAYETHAEFTKRLFRGEDLRATSRKGNGGAAEPGQNAPPAVTVGDLADEFLRRYINRERKQPADAKNAISGNILK